MSCLMRSLFLYFIRSINILAIVWRLCVFAFIQYYNIYFIYMSYTSLFSLLSSSLLLIPLFLSVSPWNGHLRLSALSGMSGTQLSSHGEEGESGRRMRGECYFKSPAQSPRKDQSEWKGKCGWERRTVWETVKGHTAFWKKQHFLCYVRQTNLQPDLLNVSVWSSWQKKVTASWNGLLYDEKKHYICTWVICPCLNLFLTKWAQSQILSQVIITSWQE